MAPEALAQVLRPIQELFDPADHPDLLVGLGVPDDAAVYRLDDEQALIFTTDFFTPIVDDAYDYGAIAAANALSDIYAMGGRPVLALNIAAFPENLPPHILRDVLRGAAEKVKEANAVIAGGHTIRDEEPKVGLAAVGLAHPERIFTKANARPGDVLVLTKPLGTGCITTAAKNDQANPTDVEEAIMWMSRLNRAAAEAATKANVRAATDVTGFGLLGHGTEFADLSGVTFELHVDALPFLSGARTYAQQWIFPGGSSDNKRMYEGNIRFADDVTDEERMLLFDAQTSGGLLLAIAPDAIETFKTAMADRDAPYWIVGIVQEREDVSIIAAR